MKIDVKIVDRELIVALDGIPSRLVQALEDKLSTLMGLVRVKVEENLSGAVLQTKSGALKGSLVSGVERIGSSTFVGFVDVGPMDAKVAAYAMVHEYGGKDYYEIVPVHKRMLRFVGKSGDVVFAPYVYHPPAQERSYLRSALWAMESEIVEGLDEALESALAKP